MTVEGPAVSPLNQWDNFYVIIGSSAGALTGLQFVVIALVAEAQAASSMLEIRAFGTPELRVPADYCRGDSYRKKVIPGS